MMKILLQTVKKWFLGVTIDKKILTTVLFFNISMAYNLQRKIKFTFTRYIENLCTWEKKIKIKKRIKNVIDNIKESTKKLNAIIYLNI